MPDWKDIDIDEILNFDDAQTGKMARYERIMRHKEVMALEKVWNGLTSMKQSLNTATDKIEKQLKNIEQNEKKIAQQNTRLQFITILLTVVIAAATVAYTVITWKSVQAQRETNEIERMKLTISAAKDQ